MRAVLLGMTGLLMLAGSAAQEISPGKSHATGLIPLDAAQVEKIVSTWPRVTGVGLNPLGFERVNAVRAHKGKAPLDPRLIKPVGAETRSAVGAAQLAALPAAPEGGFAGDLPESVDNSLLPYFPPIRDQAPLNSCASFVPTYTQLSYMTAFQRNLDIRDPADNTNTYSPKWTYNMVNGGQDAGSGFTEVYDLLEKHGAATWAEFPYDADFLGWCLDGAVWRRALAARTMKTQYVDSVSSEGLELLKTLLANGYVVVFGTYINSWNFREIQDDPATAADDAAVGKPIAYWTSGTEGSHAMTIVGYNDGIWTDINSDGYVDPGEKGAFRIANSWGTQWGEAGFTWLAYDALRVNSSVFGAPAESRRGAIQGDMAMVLTARDRYSPLMIAEFTARTAKRSQVLFRLGISDTSTDSPSAFWDPAVLQRQGGPDAFDGSTTAVDGTFVLDFSDILVAGAGPQRYYLGLFDYVPGEPAFLNAFKLVDLTTDPPTEAASSAVPLTVDNDRVYVSIDYSYGGPGHNHPPELSYPFVNSTWGRPGDVFTFGVNYTDPDGDVPAVANVLIDGVAYSMALFSGGASSGAYRFTTALPVGPHSFSCHFEDGRGGSARAPIAGEIDQPAVYSHLIGSFTPPFVLAGSPSFILIVNGVDLPSGGIVTWDGSDRPTTCVSSSQMTAQIDAADLVRAKYVTISVRDPAGGYGDSHSFQISNPFPSLASLNPTITSGGGQSVELTLYGSGFVTNSRAECNGLARPTTFVSDTELRTSLLAADLAAAGQTQVAVTNPPPGGGTTRSVGFMVTGFIVNGESGTVSGTAGTTLTTTVRVSSDDYRYPFDRPVSLRCISLPFGCTASFSPPELIPGVYGATSTLTIKTKAGTDSSSGAGLGRDGFPPEAAGLVLALLLLTAFTFAGRSLRAAPGHPASRRLGFALLVLLMVGLASCGGGGSGTPHSQGTPPGNYRPEVQATSGTMTASTFINLTIY